MKEEPCCALKSVMCSFLWVLVFHEVPYTDFLLPATKIPTRALWL